MKRGFTLIELLIYVGIFAIVAGLLTSVLTTSLKVNQKESTADETTSQINFVLQTIQGLVRESSAIIVNSSSTNIATDYNIGTNSTIGSPQSRLVLRMHDSLESSSTARDPIIITLASTTDQYGNPINSIVMYQGNNGYQGNNYQTSSTLTNARVTVDQLQFTKYTQYPGHDTVTIDMQISYNINSPAKTTRNIHSAISRVSAATFDSSVLPGSAYTYSLGQNGSPWQNIYMAPGSAANPSYTFTGNPNLGIFSPTTNQIGFSTAGAQRMVIDQNGNVGIGTVGPLSKLSITGASTPGDASDQKGIFQITTGSGLNTDNKLIFGVHDGDYSWIQALQPGNNNRNIVFNPFGGNIGIRTVSPLASLDVIGPNGSSSEAEYGTTNTFTFETGKSTGDQILYMGNDKTNHLSYLQSVDYNTAVEPLLLNARGGNVGIGTAGPAYPLDVAGQIHSSSGGFVFPDGTTQTSAATANIVTSLYGANHINVECSFLGGTVVNVSGNPVCRLNSACPTGWTAYPGWTATNPNTCVGSSSCGPATSCTTGSHSWSNQAQETCSYNTSYPTGFGCGFGPVTCYATITQVACY